LPKKPAEHNQTEPETTDADALPPLDDAGQVADAQGADALQEPVLSDRRWQQLKNRLSGSKFRSRFQLRGKELDYLRQKGMPTITRHARDFVLSRLSVIDPDKDGKQTPMRGHPVFIAQHATATCCRGCIAKWHHIPTARPLTDQEQAYLVDVIRRWIEEQAKDSE